MSNGLITSFFSSVLAGNEPPLIESKDTNQDHDCHIAEGNGLTLDLAGLLRSGCDDDGKMKKKKKRKHRKRGHAHLAKLSKEDSSVSLGGVEVDSVELSVCEEVTIMEPDDSVVCLSPLKQEPSMKHGTGGRLSESWKHVFCRTQKKSPVKRSPKRCRSPRQPSMSPKRCRSPRQLSVQKQVQKLSPLKQHHNMVKRQLLTTPTNKSSPPVDHAPFTGLVHVQQINEESMSIGKTVHHPLTLPLRFLVPYTLQEVTSFLGVSDHQHIPSTTPFFEAVVDPSACLQRLQREHPHLCVSDIYSRYCSLTKRALHGSSSEQGSVNEGSLMCSVSVRLERGGKIVVESSAYPKQSQLHDHMHSDLWSSVYRPRNSSEVLGNSKQCSDLCAWLNKWKSGFSSHAPPAVQREHGANRKHRKCRKINGWWGDDRDEDFVPPEKVNLSKGRNGLCQRYLAGDGSSSEGEGAVDGEEGGTSVMLLSGPSGAGKTAAVYASADQLGFRVFEVNSSTARGRSQVLASLREVTLSHLVTQRKRNGFTSLHGNQQQAIALDTNTLILLEDVDVLFEEEDRGFWSAVYEIIQSTKRPFIMTCSDASMDLSCPHSKLIFSRPTSADLALHICLLSLAHGVSLSSESANQIVDSFNCDIRKTFHYMHTWLSWSPSNSIETPPSSPQLPVSCCVSADWRTLPTSAVRPPSNESEISPTNQQSELLNAASVADHLATLDLLSSTEAIDSSPWWRVAPGNHLLDELSETTPTDAAVALTKQGIVVELSRLSMVLPDQQKRSTFELHHSLKTCTQAFSLNWRLAHVAMVMEGIPLLRLISILEEQRKLHCSKRRFRHYLQHCSDVSIQDLNMLANCTFV